MLAALVLIVACEDASTPLNVVPLLPEHYELVGTDQTGMVGEPLAEPIVLTVTDEFGNPTPHGFVEVELPDEAGSLQISDTTTDEGGRIEASWTLGTRAGEYAATLHVTNLEPITFRATAEPGPPDSLTRSGDSQAAPAGTALPEPLVVEVADRYGNPIRALPVEWEVTAGDAALDSASAATDSLGRAHAWLTVGTTQTASTIVARVDTLPEVEFRAVAGNPLNLVIDGFHLTQSTQTYGGSVPLVAGRDGYLRVFVLSDTANIEETDVRVDFYDGGTLLDSRVIAAPSSSVPVTADEGTLAGSWNVSVPGDLIVPGLSVLVEVDPGDGVFERDEGDNTFPASGTPLALDVRSLPTFEARLVPVYVPANGTTGNVHGGNLDDYLADADAMFPIPEYDADLHSTFTTSASGVSTDEQWNTILNEVDALRVSEASSRYYYGVLANPGGAAYCGVGYIGAPTAVGLDVCGGMTAAHEWGHNFGRRHAPCGDPGGVDPSYPDEYAGASIGVYGFDLSTLELKSPTEYVDLMSYCSPEWISDYTYEAVLDFREDEAAAPAADGAVQPTLLIWGRSGPDGLVLEPAVQVDTRPVLPERDGPFTISGVDASGGEVFRLSFAATPVADGPEGTRHFAFAVPLATVQPRRLARLRLEGPGGAPVEVAGGARQADMRPAPAVDRVGARRYRVAWNANAYPMVVASDEDGRILAFGRGGSATIMTDAAQVDLSFTDGLRTTRARRTLPR